MSPLADLLLRLGVIVAFFGLVAAVTCWRRQTDPDAAAVVHDRTCTWCAEIRHPSNRHARIALAAIPRQTRKGGR